MKKTKRKLLNNRRTKKIKGGADDMPCGLNDKGEKIKCPTNHRCENVDGKQLCKPSIEIHLSNKENDITLFVPWKRHKKWLEYRNLLTNNIHKIIQMRSNKDLNRKKLNDMNNLLLARINDKKLIKTLSGANNSDELIIQNIIFEYIIESQNQGNNEETQKDIPQEEVEETKEEQIEETKEEEQEANEEQIEETKEEEEANQEQIEETKENEEEEEANQEQIEETKEDELQEIQNKLGIIPSDRDSKEYNNYLKQLEKNNYDYLKNKSSDEFLYPELDDPKFNIQISKKKEFFDTQYDGKIYDVKTQAEKLCNKSFELLPHQLFVRNFLSLQTPYNSLLLYHGLGTGKTCSAIGIAEENRSYYKNIGLQNKIIIVATPNVQSNFKTQLFDENKLKLESGIWNLHNCVGNELLKELNPVQLQSTTKDKVILQIKSLIKQYYAFMGYGEFANYVKKKTMVSDDTGLTSKEKKIIEINNIKKHFNNRLLIVDEVHNISSVQTNKINKKTSAMLMHISKYADNLRLLLLSATPMYNTYREIIWLTNLLNIVDKRSTIREEEVFDNDGNFIEEKTNADGLVIEGGRELLTRKLTGYVSYVRGENPYTFPYRIYPDLFDESHSIKSIEYPKLQMNKKPIEEPLKYLPLYINDIGSYQNKVYQFIMKNLSTKVFSTSLQENNKNLPNFENMESFGYIMLTSPIQSLNIVYPNENFDELNFEEQEETPQEEQEEETPQEEQEETPQEEQEEETPQEEQEEETPQEEQEEETPQEEQEQEETSQEEQEEEETPQEGGANDQEIDKNQVSEEDDINLEENEHTIESMIGSTGLKNTMDYKYTKQPYLLRHSFEYKPNILEKYGRIFSPDEIMKYSSKIHNICNIIKKSKGIIMIYSQYIDSGVVPLALALEEIGFTRFGNASYTKSLFKNAPTDPIDALTMKTKKEMDDAIQFKSAKYTMITGDKHFSPDNSADLKIITSKENKYGEKVKVVLITKAAAEGLDFKNIRQLHILDPWYNASRIEQIIGRSVRNLSHCELPFEERNVEIYLHATQGTDENETTDMYIYRYAEKKAIQIGKVSRLLKETAVDCILNIGQTNLTLEKLTENANNQKIDIQLSSTSDNKTITYEIGDKPYTELCDYMDSCNYVCVPNEEINPENISKHTYNEQYLKTSYSTIIKRIRDLIREQSFFSKEDLVKKINYNNTYPIEHIDYALDNFINNKNDYVLDIYGRQGYLINKGQYYIFQPFEIPDEFSSLYDRVRPVDNKIKSLDIELPTEKEKITKEKTKTTNNEEKKNMTFHHYMKELNNNIDYINKERDIRRQMKEKYSNLESMNKRVLSHMREQYGIKIEMMDWYKNAGIIYDLLTNTLQINESTLKKLFIHHYLDTLHLNDHLIISAHLHMETEINVNNKDILIEYYDNRKLAYKDKIGIYLPSNNKNVLYVWNNDHWTTGEPTDIILFEKLIDEKFSISNNKINFIFGFISYFKKKYVFKVRNLKQDKNNTGVICESLGKTDILHRIEPIIKENPHNIENWPSYESIDFDSILKPGLCVLLECLMRYYNEANIDKFWFLNTIQINYNKSIKN
jgi:flagellar motor protein MotB